ncbi:hypothetical protein QUB47_15555 [Microcoleus sp. AT9_B5]
MPTRKGLRVTLLAVYHCILINVPELIFVDLPILIFWGAIAHHYAEMVCHALD